MLYEYDIFWVSLIISSIIPILAFIISKLLAPIVNVTSRNSNLRDFA